MAPTSKEDRISAYKERYRTTVAEYAQPKQDASFERAFSALVNTQFSHVFDTLLQLEQNYARSLSQEWTTHEREVTDMKARHVLEIRRLKAHKVSNTKDVFDRHSEELDFLLASFESKLFQIYEDQKVEYRDYVLKLYNELQSHFVDGISPARLNPSVIEDGKIVVSAAIGRLEKSPSLEMLLIDPKTALPSQETKELNALSDDKSKDPSMVDVDVVTSEEAQFESKLKELIEMGFSANDGEAALTMHNGDLALSVTALLETPLEVKLYRKNLDRAKASSSGMHASRATSNNSSLNSTRAHSRMPSSQGSINSPTFGALKFKKGFNQMLNKAMEAFKMEGAKVEEESESLPITQPMSETFTVYFGSHIRNMYNLRVEEYKAAAMDPVEQFGLRASTLSSLYSENLTGLILILDKADFPRYAQGLTVNRDTIMECRRSTEFHFDNIVQQVYVVSKLLPQDEAGNPILQSGDFFVTKHSNLTSYHVLFHLITDSSQAKDKPLSQSPEIMGYRSILSIAHACDVTSLVVPLDLSPPGTILSDADFYRRVETVLKSTRGSLMESNHNKNEKGLKTGGFKFIFQFADRDIQRITELLTGIFRVV